MRVSMIALGVKDTARSIKFYGETLGFQLVAEPEPGEVAVFQAGGVQITLNRPLGKAAGSAIVGAIEVILTVDSVVTTHGKLVERGCTFIKEPREVFTGTWAATFTDPDGHRLTILGPR
jgi:predicted enzyme related to lactoylglutathione lyase